MTETMEQLPPDTPTHRSHHTHKMARWVYFSCGMVSLILGIIGAFLPVMPTTIFIIIAAWCFSKSSEKMELWLLNHKSFGPPLRDWQDYGAIPYRIKIIAISMIFVSFALSSWALWGRWHILAIVGATLLAVTLYIATRPKPPVHNNAEK